MPTFVAVAPLTPEDIKTLKGHAAALIRHHLWLGPDAPESPDSRPWTMGRELSVWQRLVDAGYNPEHLNGAITVVRNVSQRAEQLTMLIFYWKKGDEFTATPFLERCVATYLRRDGERTDNGLRTPKQLFDDYLRTYGQQGLTSWMSFSDYKQEVGPGSDTVTGEDTTG